MSARSPRAEESLTVRTAAVLVLTAERYHDGRTCRRSHGSFNPEAIQMTSQDHHPSATFVRFVVSLHKGHDSIWSAAHAVTNGRCLPESTRISTGVRNRGTRARTLTGTPPSPGRSVVAAREV